MSRKRKVMDEYPEQIRQEFQMLALTPGACNDASGTLTIFEWVMPVDINLTNPTFVELNSIRAEVDDSLRFVDSTAIVAASNSLAFYSVADIWVSKERRTQAPNLNDNSIIAHFVLVKHLKWGCDTASSAQNVAVLDHGASNLTAERNYEDEKTGQGFLIAQPRLFVLIQDRAASGPGPIIPAAQSFGLTMTYRLTTRVSAREFMTEVIANTFA